MVLTSQPMTLETFRVMYHLTTDQIAMEAFPGMPVEEAKRRWKASELANHTMNPLMSWNISPSLFITCHPAKEMAFLNS